MLCMKIVVIQCSLHGYLGKPFHLTSSGFLDSFSTACLYSTHCGHLSHLDSFDTNNSQLSDKSLYVATWAVWNQWNGIVERWNSEIIFDLKVACRVACTDSVTSFIDLVTVLLDLVDPSSCTVAHLVTLRT